MLELSKLGVLPPPSTRGGLLIPCPLSLAPATEAGHPVHQLRPAPVLGVSPNPEPQAAAPPAPHYPQPWGGGLEGDCGPSPPAPPTPLPLPSLLPGGPRRLLPIPARVTTLHTPIEGNSAPPDENALGGVLFPSRTLSEGPSCQEASYSPHGPGPQVATAPLHLRPPEAKDTGKHSHLSPAASSGIYP